jgi:hypothetical protein
MRFFLFLTLGLSAFSCANDDEPDCADVYKGDVIITSQQELNDFGRCNYRIIEGALRLSGVDDLTPLENLVQVQNIYIRDTYLKTLNGLYNLNELAGRELNQYGNYKGPNEIGNYHEEGRIEIRGNNELHSLEGLSSLINIPIITVSNNVKLYDFCELSGDIEGNVHYVVEGNEFNPTRDLLRNQIQCKKLKNENCDQDFEEHLFTGDVDIINQQELIDFGTLNYSSIEGTLSITNVNDLNGLEGIKMVTNLKITDTNIINLDALQCLTDVNSIELKNNPFLENIKGLMYADISRPNVFDFNVLEFENESGSLVISNNDALINLEGLERIEYLKTVLIEDNDALVSIEALSHLIFISDPGRDSEYPDGDYLKIINNDALLSLRGLDNTKVNHIYIHENDALTNLEGLSSITHLDLLSVKNNSNIISLDGLNNLNEISAFYDVYEISGYTFIINNINLHNYCVLKDVYFLYYPSDDHYQLTGNAYNPTYSQLITTDGCFN